MEVNDFEIWQIDVTFYLYNMFKADIYCANKKIKNGI